MTTSDAPTTKRSGRKGKFIAGGIAAAVVLALVAGFVISQQAGKATITTAAAATQDLTVTVSAPGTMQAATQTAVYSPVAGTLASVKVTEGQSVKKGDVLATLDAGSLDSALAQAKSAVAAAQAQAAGADAQLAAARAMPTSTSKLRAARNAAIDAAQAAQQAAKSAKSAANSALRVAQGNADSRSIKAPAAGTVTFPVLAITSLDGTGPKAAAGASISTASPVFTIVDLAKVVFAAQVDEADIAGVTTKAKVSVTLDAYPSRPFDGTVSQIATSSMTTKTGGTAYVVKVPLTPGDAVLRLGMSGNATIETQAIAGALVVPTQAVQADGDTRFVYVVSGDKVAKTPVKIGAATDTLTQITAGLTAGQEVATSQFGSLKDGASVNVSR